MLQALIAVVLFVLSPPHAGERERACLSEQQPLAGVALPLHSRDPAYDYARELREIADLGAGWVSLVTKLEQERVDSAAIMAAYPPPERLAATITRARAAGLRVLVLPIVALHDAGTDGWRGVLRPHDVVRWWASYTQHMNSIAVTCKAAGASALCVGSELASLEGHTQSWTRLIRGVRRRFDGALTYSANWDHFDRAEFWPELDFASMTAYFTLSTQSDPSRHMLARGWRRALREMRRLGRVAGLPVVLSEVGVPSQRGAAGAPWDYTRNAAFDVGLQARAFRAFRDVFMPTGTVVDGCAGVVLYDWWGLGGPTDKSYTARGKPAADEWRALLSAM